MRLTSRQSISPWCATRRVFAIAASSKPPAANSRRHRHGTDCAAIPHPSTKLPPRKTARSDALTIEMSALEARPPTAPESWLLSGISSPPWVHSRHTSHPTSQAGSARDSAPDTARPQPPYPSDNALTHTHTPPPPSSLPPADTHTRYARMAVSPVPHSSQCFFSRRWTVGCEDGRICAREARRALLRVAYSTP